MRLGSHKGGLGEDGRLTDGGEVGEVMRDIKKLVEDERA